MRPSGTHLYPSVRWSVGPSVGRSVAQCIITDQKSIVIFSCSKTLLDYSRSFFKTLAIVKQLREI